MSINPIHIGKNPTSFDDKKVQGELINIDGESYYKISNNNLMRPFFMSIVSDSNHWMFISSNGGLSAGRKDCDNSLFPYYTDDKITESTAITGSKTILHIHTNDKVLLWEPFSDSYSGIYDISRNLYKNNYGNTIIFEEANHELGLTFRYQWSSSNQFGFVKKSSLINTSKQAIGVSVLDGIQNIVPYGVTAEMQNTRSNLVDAYKRCELNAQTGLGIYALSAIIVDKAEPSEALKASVVWSVGIEAQTYLISSLQLNKFRKGLALDQEVDIKAEKGAYFIQSDFKLSSSATKSWKIVANVNQSITSINFLSEQLKNADTLNTLIEKDIRLGTTQLSGLGAAADGLQFTADKLRDTRHFSNVMFNIMRGGIFDDNYQIEKLDVLDYLKKANAKVYKQHLEGLERLPEIVTLPALRQWAEDSSDFDLKRLCFEYMPLKFSRRHGDPSRPWNKFSINTRSELDGSKILDYEGNWRDIFQNWEALAHAYPQFIDSMIHKFLNASTFEGYNPYRVTKNGFDWEVIDEHDPWAYIGYWGDHQIIYLLKFLEFIEDHYPNRLGTYFDKELFVYANVPYKIKSYEALLDNPKDTIIFDAKLNDELIRNKELFGADAVLLTDQKQSIYRVNLIEKLLATTLAKVSNFIPEAGIWLNTQRPEWNDANNALVGNGVSMVTLCYLERFITFFEALIAAKPFKKVLLSEELLQFFKEVLTTLDRYLPLLDKNVSDIDRKSILDGLGHAASVYRTSVYENGFKGLKSTLSGDELRHFLKITKTYLVHTIEANKRTDHLYHSYNLMTITDGNGIAISQLNEMLEGQVAILSSGYLRPSEVLRLLDGLKNSALFRHDQYSYLLYPDKELAGFMDKNNIPGHYIDASPLLNRLIADGNTQIIEKDIDGAYHFNGSFNNASSLIAALNHLPSDNYASLIAQDRELLLEAFEAVFDHKSFTGRSGKFYGYEGLGSIYWHMVSKLVLAVQEQCLKAIATNESPELIGKLLAHYYEMDEGIGVHKSPELYGAFPTDPYSHTPAGKGAQQPGMTGQVKEDILSRFGELGVFVKDGMLQFKPDLLRKTEFLKSKSKFRYTNVFNEQKEIVLEKNTLAFTYCQIPVVYTLGSKIGSSLLLKDTATLTSNDLCLSKDLSGHVFQRDGHIEQINITVVGKP